MNLREVLKIFDIRVYMLDITEMMYNYVIKKKQNENGQYRNIYPEIK